MRRSVIGRGIGKGATSEQTNLGFYASPWPMTAAT
jgi:hypothetical protein